MREAEAGRNQRRAEHSLQVSEARYRRLFETAQDGILILDADTGRMTDVNPYLVKLLGYAHGDLLGKNHRRVGSFKDSVAPISSPGIADPRVRPL